jgi:hypothetical protein
MLAASSRHGALLGAIVVNKDDSVNNSACLPVTHISASIDVLPDHRVESLELEGFGQPGSFVVEEFPRVRIKFRINAISSQFLQQWMGAWRFLGSKRLCQDYVIVNANSTAA